jgi:type VI protein secretion system component Hcp
MPVSNIGSSGQDGVGFEPPSTATDDGGISAEDDWETPVAATAPDGTLGGNAETEWKVEEGESSASADSFFDVFVEVSNDGGDSTERRRGDVILEDLSVRGAYIKIDDIKGEAIDNKRPVGSQATIVIDGANARDEATPKILNLQTKELDKASPKLQEGAGSDTEARVDSFFDIFTEVTDDGLALQAVAIAQNDEKIESISLNFEEVEVTYKSQGKILGFIPVNLKQRVTVDTSDGDTFGEVKVKFPWWAFLAKKDSSVENTERTVQTEMLSMDLRAAAPSQDGDDRPTEEVAFYYNKIQSAALEVLSNTLKAQ